MISNFSKFVDYKKCFLVLDQLPYLAFLLMTEFLPCSALNALSATCSTMLDRLTTSGAWGAGALHVGDALLAAANMLEGTKREL